MQNNNPHSNGERTYAFVALSCAIPMFLLCLLTFIKLVFTDMNPTAFESHVLFGIFIVVTGMILHHSKVYFTKSNKPEAIP